MKFFQHKDHFQVIPGEAPIVVGAPHHGTRPGVTADQGTGPIALALAEKLKARAVIVSDLRHMVDVNKNPAGFSGSARLHAVRYQNELFKDFPSLIIEIHGNATGNYPVEVATGFDLSPDSPGDAVFLERLRLFKSALDAEFSSCLGQSYPIGVFPLERNVKKTATNTFAFQKIRRARNLVGLEWYGLHIELPASMRIGKQAQTVTYIDLLTDALVSAIRTSFEPLPVSGATIPLKADTDFSDPAARRFFEVAPALEKYAEQAVALLHPDDLEAVGALEGDQLSLYNEGESLHVAALSSPIIQRGQAALPSRIRRQINLMPRQKVGLGLRGHPSFAPKPAAPTCHLMVADTRADEKKPVILMTPTDAARFGFESGSQVLLKGQSPLLSPLLTEIQLDDRLAARTTIISRPLMDKIPVTLAEVITIESA